MFARRIAEEFGDQQGDVGFGALRRQAFVGEFSVLVHQGEALGAQFRREPAGGGEARAHRAALGR